MKPAGAALLVLVLSVGAFLAWVEQGRTSPAPAPLPSSRFPGTAILATLDQPIPPGKNAVWCAAFPLAWSAAVRDLAGAPLVVPGAEALCAALNGSDLSEADLPPGRFYVRAGWGRDGIVGQIRAEMVQRFGRSPSLPDPGSAGLAYAYLKGGFRFAVPYFEERAGIPFGETRVRAFGVRDQDGSAHVLRQQVGILSADRRNPEQFILDLDVASGPSQLLVARMPREATLRATIEAMDRRIQAPRPLSLNDVLLVPEVSFSLDHRFAELEAGVVGRALQTLQFRLDRGGVELEAEAKVLFKSIPARYVVDGPFLIVLRLRGTIRPYFAAWIENAELLRRP